MKSTGSSVSYFTNKEQTMILDQYEEVKTQLAKNLSL